MNTRIRALAAQLQADEAALILSEPNRLYYSGFAADNGALWVTADDACLLTDFRYIEAAEKQATVDCRESNRLFRDALAALKAKGIKKIFLEDETLTVADRRVFLRAAEGVELVSDHTLCRLIWAQRRIKDASEIALIKEAQAVTEAGFAYILPRLTAGRTEKDVALDLEMFMRRNGADSVAFDCIVASGENGSLPHAVPSERTLRRGDFVTMDFGATVKGYRSDMTRTVALGNVDEEQRRVYDTVLEAQTVCLAGLHAGLTGEEGDRLARAVIEHAGYGEAFGHSTGHGVGIDIHEQPRLSPHADEVLKVGDVVTVEPGIYLAGRFGVRIEDMVVVHEADVLDLTTAEKGLILL